MLRNGPAEGQNVHATHTTTHKDAQWTPRKREAAGSLKSSEVALKHMQKPSILKYAPLCLSGV